MFLNINCGSNREEVVRGNTRVHIIIAKCKRISTRIEFEDPVYTSQEEFENGGFTLKTHQMFCIHTALEEICLSKTRSEKSHDRRLS